MLQTRPHLTGRPVALFVFSNLREQKFGLTRAWLRRLRVFHDAGWDTHVATIHKQPEIDETLRAWRERGWLPWETTVHHYQRRDRRFRPAWHRPTDAEFSRDDRIADWLDWLVGAVPGTVVFADSPVTYAPVALMKSPFIGRVMTVHLNHRDDRRRRKRAERLSDAQPSSRYGSLDGLPKLATRFLPFAPRADVVVAPTVRQADHLREDLPGVDVRVIPNIVDRPTVEPIPERDRLRVVYLGRMDPVKRVDHAMRAVALAAQSVPGLHLDMYGRGHALDDVLAQRDRLGLAGVVRYCGFTDHPERELAASGLSVLTAAKEPFGLSVAESLAVGTPVVAYDVDYGPSELIDDGRNGRLVRSGSVEEMAQAIAQLASDPALWARMSEQAPRAIERLSTPIVSAHWLELAGQVLESIPLPDRRVVVEDLRVLRDGLEVSGVCLSAPGRHPATDLLVPGGSAQVLTAGQPAFGPELEVREVAATLSWPLVDRWPEGAALVALGEAGEEVPLTAEGVPMTVALSGPTAATLTRDQQARLVRVTPPEPPELEATAGGLRARVGQDVTPITETPALSARLVGATADPAVVAVSALAPGPRIVPPIELAVVARGSGAAARIGTARVPEGADLPGGVAVTARIEWDQRALEDLSDAEAAAFTLSLAAGRSLRAVGSLSFAAARPLSLVSSTRWLLAPGRDGSLLLVRGWGVRHRASWMRRRMARPNDGD